jgi:urease accessory protein
VPPASAWCAELELGFAPRPGRTALVRRRHAGPLLVQRPFYPEGEVCHVYIVHPPGGVVGGDRLDLRVACAAGAQVLLTTPAAGKFYRSGGRAQRADTALALAGASLEWLPQESIYYPGAAVRQRLTVRLDPASRFIGWDIGCFGLPARGAGFESGSVAQGIEVWLGERPLLLDQLQLGHDAGALQAAWGLAGFPVLGTFIAYPAAGAALDDLRAVGEVAAGEGRFGLSIVDGLLVGRCVAQHADRVKRCFAALWQALRPALMGRQASAPRIWAT